MSQDDLDPESSRLPIKVLLRRQIGRGTLPEGLFNLVTICTGISYQL